MRTALPKFLWTFMLILACVAALPARSMAQTHIVPPPSGGDDTAMIQAELDWADQTGTIRVVQLQSGTYTVSTLVIGSGTTLEGAGADSTVLLMSTDRSKGRNVLRNRLNSSTAAPYNRNVTLRGITFDGNKAAQTGSSLQIVKMTNVVGLTVDGCTFRNGQSNGLVIEGTNGLQSNTLVKNSNAFDNEARGFYPYSGPDENGENVVNGLRGVTFENCLARGNSGGFSGYLIKGLNFINCTADSNGFIARGYVYGDGNFDIGQDDNPGFTIDSSVDVTYTDCVSKDNARDGFTAYARARPIQNLTYTRCTSVRNGAQHAADNDVALDARGFRVTTGHDISYIDCKSSSNGIGFELVTTLKQDAGTNPIVTNDVLIQGADIRKNRKQGIQILGVTDSTVRDSVIVNNGTHASATYDGILLQNGILNATGQGSLRIIITNNLISNTDGLPHQRYGVRSINSCDSVTLTNNRLSGNTLPNSTALSYSLVGNSNVVSGNY